MKAKELILVLFLLGGAILMGVSDANAWDQDGTWVNLDETSGGIDHLVINYPVIQGFGQCSPTPCDWGNAGYVSKLVATSDRVNNDRDEYLAVWFFSFKISFVYISPHPENPDYIIVKTYDLYDVMGDSRSNRYTIEYLKRQ